jgi:hypothetical protein
VADWCGHDGGLRDRKPVALQRPSASLALAKYRRNTYLDGLAGFQVRAAPQQRRNLLPMARLNAAARKARLNGGGFANPSRITTGADIIPSVDHRTVWVKRFRDVRTLLISDRGGEDACSEGEKLLARRAACLEVELLALETTFATAGQATPEQLNQYMSGTNAQRRVLESLGLKRTPRDIEPSLEQYLASKGQTLHSSPPVDVDSDPEDQP